MKSALKMLALVALALTPAAALAANDSAQTSSTFDIPKEISVRFELQESPELTTADSWWEVTLQIGVEEERLYMRWLAEHAGNPPAGATRPGVVLIKKSFPRRSLSKKDDRTVEVKVPVSGELLQRFRQLKKKTHTIWLKSSIHVHAGKADADVINDNISPTWNLRYFIDKGANVKVTLSTTRRLTWTYGGTRFPPPAP